MQLHAWALGSAQLHHSQLPACLPLLLPVHCSSTWWHTSLQCFQCLDCVPQHAVDGYAILQSTTSLKSPSTCPLAAAHHAWLHSKPALHEACSIRRPWHPQSTQACATAARSLLLPSCASGPAACTQRCSSGHHAAALQRLAPPRGAQQRLHTRHLQALGG